MGCDGKLSPCTLETGSLIFAVINAVISAVATIASIGLLIAINVLPIQEPYSYNRYENRIYISESYHPSPVVGTPLGEIIFSVLLITCLINFVFAVLLCNGVKKRNTDHIMAYFIFGIVKAVVLSIIAIIVLIVVTPAAIALIAFTVGYCLILHMINMTRKKFLSGIIFNQHKPLFTNRV